MIPLWNMDPSPSPPTVVNIRRGIAAGLHQGLSAEELARICIDCKADVIVVESEALLKRVLLVQHKLPELKCIVQWRGEPPLSDQRRLAKSHKKHILSWEGLLELGRALQPDRLEERLTKVAINQCCALVYATSNKGVMLSHDNLTWSAKMALGVLRAPGFNPTPSPGHEVMISFLPLAHISTQLIDIYYLISVAGTLVFPAKPIAHNQESFFAALKEVLMPNFPNDSHFGHFFRSGRPSCSAPRWSLSGSTTSLWR